MSESEIWEDVVGGVISVGLDKKCKGRGKEGWALLLSTRVRTDMDVEGRG